VDAIGGFLNGRVLSFCPETDRSASQILSESSQICECDHLISMRVVILICHANDNETSTSHRVAARARDALLEDHHEVRVVDLAKIGFVKVATRADFTSLPKPNLFDYETSHIPGNANLVQEITDQQAHVTWCTHLIIVGPMWYYRYPACFYAWAERVLNDSFGYTTTDFGPTGPLRGRKVLCVITLGTAEALYKPDGPLTTVEGILYHVTRGHFGYVGMTSLRSQTFYECLQQESPCDAPEIVEKWKRAVKNLDRRPVLPLGDAATPCGPGNLNEGQIIAGLGDLSLDDAIKA
jgi:putative NADPH-quinone reductase